MSVAFRVLGYRLLSLTPSIVDSPSLLQHSRFQHSRLMESHHNAAGNPSYVTSAHYSKGTSSGSSGGRGRGIETKDSRQRSRGNGRTSSGSDKINALGRLLYVVMLVFLWILFLYFLGMVFSCWCRIIIRSVIDKHPVYLYGKE